MNDQHLTDIQLQQYLFGTGNPGTIATHLASCEACRLQAENYRLIFSGVAKQPAASFDFVVSDFVMANLPSKKSSKIAERFFLAIGLAGILVVLVPAYFVLSMTIPVTPSIGFWLIMLSAAFIVFFLLTEKISDHIRKMRLLNAV